MVAMKWSATVASIALFATACGTAQTLPTRAPPSSSALPAAGSPANPSASNRLGSAIPSAAPTEAAVLSSSPSAAPVPGGRLAYGRFSPDGTQHAFTSKPDGTDEKALLPSNAEGPRWSPDGRHLSVVEGRVPKAGSSSVS